MPAQSHPDVIIAAVAARDETKARAFAQRWRIPQIYTSYQTLLDDKTLDAVYIALPNGLHYEWALKALKAGKHVLLEKPSTSNAQEAEKVFRSPLLERQKPEGREKSLVLMEAFHTFFHPAFEKYLSLIDRPNIVEAHASLELMQGIIAPNDIRFDFGLAGGSLMDCGTYAVHALRQTFGQEPVECTEASPRRPIGGDERIDEAMTATWTFPNGGIGSVSADLITTAKFPFSHPSFRLPICKAVHREVTVYDDTLAEGQEHVMTKTVIFWNYVTPSVWHRIDVFDHHIIRNQGNKNIVKQWTQKSYVKEYGEQASWMTYRHQLEEFVNRIRGGKGSHAWNNYENSIKQMKVIDSAYVKAGLPIRPSSTFVAAE